MPPRQRLLLMASLFTVGVVGLLMWYSAGSIVLATLDEVPDVSWGADIRSSAAAGSLIVARDADALYDPDDEAYRGAKASRYFYPPWYAVLMIPLSTIPFPALFFLWSAAGIALLFTSVRILEIRAPVLLSVVVLATWATVDGVWFGQSSFLFLTFLALGIRFALHDRQVSAGVAMALCAFKPHLLLGFVVLWLADLRRWKTLLVSAALTTLALAAATELWIPGAWGHFFRNLLSSGELAAPDSAVSLLAGFRVLLPNAGLLVWASWGVAVAAILFSFLVTIRRWEGHTAVLIALAIFVSLLLPPHGLPYDWVILVAAFGLLLQYGGLTQYHTAMPFLLLAASLPIGLAATDVMVNWSGWAIHAPPLLLLATYAWFVVALRPSAEKHRPSLWSESLHL